MAIWHGWPGVGSLVDVVEPLPTYRDADLNLECEMQRYENQFCLGRPKLLVDIFERYSLDPWSDKLRIKLCKFILELRIERLKDPNSVSEFFEMINRKYGEGPFLKSGTMFKCVEEAPSFDAPELANIQHQILNYKYPYAPRGILVGTHCLLLKEDYWLFNVFPTKRSDIDVDYINHLRQIQGMQPVPEIYVTRRYKFLCFHPEIAKRHENPPKGLNPNSFREERPHIRTVLAEPDIGPGGVLRWFQKLQNPKIKAKLT